MPKVWQWDWAPNHMIWKRSLFDSSTSDGVVESAIVVIASFKQFKPDRGYLQTYMHVFMQVCTYLCTPLYVHMCLWVCMFVYIKVQGATFWCKHRELWWVKGYWFHLGALKRHTHLHSSAFAEMMVWHSQAIKTPPPLINSGKKIFIDIFKNLDLNIVVAINSMKVNLQDMIQDLKSGKYYTTENFKKKLLHT